MAPRSRLKVLNSEFAETLVSLLPVHPTLSQLKSPLEDWLASDLLVIEVPVLEFGKEAVHNALQRLAIRARSQGPEIMLVVTPRSPTAATSRSRLPGASSSMRRSCCSTWTPSRGEHNAERPIRRWNEWMSCPFQLEGLCSCRFAEDGKEMHSLYYVGTSFPLPLNGPGPWDKGNC